MKTMKKQRKIRILKGLIIFNKPRGSLAAISQLTAFFVFYKMAESWQFRGVGAGGGVGGGLFTQLVTFCRLGDSLTVSYSCS